MKTKTSANKLVCLLKEETVANLNQRELGGIKGGENFYQGNGLESLLETTVCTEETGGCSPYNPDEYLFSRVTILPNCCGACE